MADLVAQRVRPVKELYGFQKSKLDPGEAQKVTFSLPASEFGFYDTQMNYVVEAGAFMVWVGTNSVEGLEGSFSSVD